MFIFPSPRIGDGDRESESGTDEEICAFYEVAIKFIAVERIYIVQINAILNDTWRAIPARCKI